jgi:hypothetical protein
MKRYFAMQLGITICLMILGNNLVAGLSKNSIPRQRLRSALATEATDVFIGNSIVECGLDPRTYEGGVDGSVALNLGIGSTTPIEHMLMYVAGTRECKQRLFYGFFGTQLTDSPLTDDSSLIGNRAMSYYFLPDLSMELLGRKDWWSRLRFNTLARIPIYVERKTIWAKVERLRRRIGELGLGAEATNRFGRVSDFAKLGNIDQELKHCVDVVHANKPLAGAIVSLLATAASRQSEVFLIEMPRPSGYRKAIAETDAWKAYREYLRSQIPPFRAVYINAIDWVADESFSDNLHLDPEGARHLTSTLVRWLERYRREKADP